MALKVPNDAERWMLNRLFNKTGSSELFNTANLKLRLATTIPDNTTINHNAMETTDITEAGFPGYTVGGTTPANWTDAITQGPDVDGYLAATSGDWIEFTKSTDDSTTQTIEGYYVVDHVEGDKLMWFEVVTTPALSVTYSGDSISILPRFTLHTEF